MVSLAVIMPSFNSMPYLDNAITEALSCLSAEDVLIVQDGGSSDGSLGVLTARSERDSRLRWVSEPDHGQSDALNRALLRASKFDYVIWLNADDFLSPRGVAAARELILHSAPDLVIGGHSVRQADGKRIRSYQGAVVERSSLFRRGCYVFSGSILFRRELLSSLGGFSDNFEYCMDLDLLLRISSRDFKQAVVPEEVGALRWHDGSKSGSQGWRFVADGWRARRAYSKGPRDLWSTFYAAVVQSLAIATTGLRHSPLYVRFRDWFK